MTKVSISYWSSSVEITLDTTDGTSVSIELDAEEALEMARTIVGKYGNE